MFYKGEIPFVRLLLPLIVGIACGYLWAIEPIFQRIGWLMVLLPIILVFLVIYYRKLSLYKKRWIPGLIIHTYFFVLGYLLVIHHSMRFDERHFSNRAVDGFMVTVNNEPKIAADIVRFECKVLRAIRAGRSAQVNGRLLIALKVDTLNPLKINYGDELLVPGRFSDIDPPFNPGEFDYKAYLGDHQIYQQMFVNQSQVRVVGHDAGHALISKALALRLKLVNKFQQYLPDKEAASIASTLILGYRADLSREVMSAYSKTGTMHVLSVSGMHVGIIFLVLTVLLKPLSHHQNLRLVRAFIIITLIWAYALITGFSPSVCRAAVMLSFVVLGRALNRSLNSYNLLAISAFFLLLYNPFFLSDVGFQLSYLAVVGLIYLYPKIYHIFHLKNKITDGIWSVCALSLAAQIATFPVSVYYFHQFPLYFLLSNVFIVLPVAVIMYAGLLFLFVPWPMMLKPLGLCLNWVILLTNKILYAIETWPLASLDGLWISVWQYLLIYILIVLIIWTMATGKKLVLLTLFLGAAVFVLSAGTIRLKNYQSRQIIFYSLRKNFAVAFIDREKAYLLTDLSEKDKTDNFSIRPALDQQGVRTIRRLNCSSRFSNADVMVSADFIRLGDFKVLRWTRAMDSLEFKGSVHVDAVWLSGNPRVKIEELQKMVTFQRILVDATNADARVRQWSLVAEKLGVPLHVLKKNPAFIVKL